MTANRSPLVRLITCCCVVILICLANVDVMSFGQTSPVEPVTDSAAQIKQLIEQLDSSSFQVREQASHRLAKIGAAAADLLDEATRSASAEVRQRATALLRQMRREPLREGFSKLAQGADDKVDLVQGMWLIARILNPRVRRADLDSELDALAKKVRDRLGGDVRPAMADPRRVMDTIRTVLIDEEKFIGNVADYGNPDNSSLEKVLATRKGLPILLSHVVVAVGDRLSLPLVGVPVPGRYLVKYDGQRAPGDFPKKDIVFDPFAGKEVTDEEIAQRLGGADLNRVLQPSGRRQTLIRMLTNLERHLFDRNRNEQAYLALECRQILESAETDK